MKIQNYRLLTVLIIERRRSGLATCNSRRLIERRTWREGTQRDPTLLRGDRRHFQEETFFNLSFDVSFSVSFHFLPLCFSVGVLCFCLSSSLSFYQSISRSFYQSIYLFYVAGKHQRDLTLLEKDWRHFQGKKKTFFFCLSFDVSIPLTSYFLFLPMFLCLFLFYLSIFISLSLPYATFRKNTFYLSLQGFCSFSHSGALFSVSYLPVLLILYLISHLLLYLSSLRSFSL